MKCSKCQAENREGVKFCEECGAKLELECPCCKAKIPSEKKFCGECGHPLTKPTESPPIDYTEPQSYTPKFLADKILTTRSSIEGERKLVTVLFADVVNYTSISEKLDPEEVHQIMDGCFKILMDEIHKYEGTINQFTGDGVMALFGAPVAHEDHAQRACYSALSIQRAIDGYGEKIKKDCGMEFKMRIGLNSGPVVVGSIGDDLRMDYTAIGDTTNLASRMESMAKSGTTVVSGNTYKIARDFFEFKPLGKVEVKGKEEPQETYELVKAGEVATRIEAAVAKGLTKFVGRKNSMAALKDAYEKARSGSGQVVGIVGEAGVGKSRLRIEFRNILPKDEYTYLEGRCLHYGGSMAYLPILDILRSYFDVKEGDREFIIKKKMYEKISHLDDNFQKALASFHDLLSLKVDDKEYLKLESKQRREKTFEAIRDLLIQLSQEKPLVFVIEDLHWIDKTTEEFLNYLTGWLANTHILMIVLYRPEYTHQWGSKSYYSKIGVDQLSTKSSAELVQAILENGDVVPELRELILNRTSGNPLFMEELTHTLLENGSIEKKDNQYVLSKKSTDINVPDSINGIIAARMDRLEDNLKRTMQVASVIGRDFAFRILHTITGMKEELKYYLQNLQGLEFIYEKRLFPELEYIFKHALTQEVAYNSLLLKRRKEIHEMIGKAIEELYAERLEEFYEMLAYHYSMSDNSLKAYQYLKSSGEKATRNFSNWEAFRIFKEAIKLLKKMPENEENKRKQIQVFYLMHASMELLGFPEDSLQLLQEGEKLSRELGDERSLAFIYSRIGLCYSLRGDLQGIKYTEKGFKAAHKIQDLELMAPAATDLCNSYLLVGENQKVVDIATSAIKLLEKSKKKSEIFSGVFNNFSILCGYCGFALATLGNFEEGEAMCEKGLSIAIETKGSATCGIVELLYGLLFVWKGDGRKAVKHCQESIGYSEEAQFVTLSGPAWGGLGFGYYLLGDLKTAREHAEKGLSIHLGSGNPFVLSSIYWFLSIIHFDLGDLKRAQTCAQKALELSRQYNEKAVEGGSFIWQGRILRKAGRAQFDKAKNYILSGIKILEDLKTKALYSQGYLFLGELYSDTGQKDLALENLKKAEAMFQEMGMEYWLGKTQEVLERL